jgi:uncharacterized protein YndB with AHSA1/START domain/TfoX/Sxy family transcriptional regulator of competence genes
MADYATSIDIDAPPDVVFEHLVTAEGMVAWMGQHAELDPRPDGTFAVDINGSPVRGRYLEVDPPHRVVVTWGVAGSDVHPAGSSRVEFTLVPVGDGTRLDLRHTGLPDERVAGHSRGWAHFAARLQVAAVGGDPGPDPWAEQWGPQAPSARERFDELARDHLGQPGVSPGQMFNSEGLKVHGRFFALLSDEQLVLKVPAAQAAALVAAGDAVPFETSPGRRMKEWVVLTPPADLDQWRAWMADARRYVASLTGAPS